MIRDSEYRIYQKVKHELLLEEARYFVIDWLSYETERKPIDIKDEELQKYNFEKLVAMYEVESSPDITSNDTWDNVLEKYMIDFKNGEK